MELWGGVECTVNRVADHWNDQLEWNGHSTREADLELFAKLGIRALRYPFLWERIAPRGVDGIDWSWSDRRVLRLSELGIRPIAGLVHHGSGPEGTHLLDPSWGEKLACYARVFARRYPGIEAYTPVNEPFTTARFGALYGHWHPHLRDMRSCVIALMNECRGTVLSMRAIREVSPAARLIQTDDLGEISGSRLLSYQVDFENERRWLGWDLLFGRVTPAHPLFDFLLGIGIDEREIRWFEENPCPPDVIGINHYVVSNRHLDERVELYPERYHGGNGRHAYADVESVRVLGAPGTTVGSLLRKAWDRYRSPLAVTEVHLGGTREEQIRWFSEIWSEADELERGGIPVRAVTAWGLLGHFDWHCLVTRREGRYEPGAWDVRSSPLPRSTALAAAVGAIGSTGVFSSPLVEIPGWWRRPDRIRHPVAKPAPEPGAEDSFGRPVGGRFSHVSPLLITGARGTLASALARICEHRGIPYRLLDRSMLDIADLSSVNRALDETRAWAVVNAAGYVRVDDAEGDSLRCFRENTMGPQILSRACSDRGIRLAAFSSDQVFDGTASVPYVESSEVSPLNLYGRSKALSEALVLTHHPGALVVRTSAFFGPWDRSNFLFNLFGCLSAGRTFSAADDVRISPTFVPDLANAVLDLLIDGESGIWHLANRGDPSWWEFAVLSAKAAGLDSSRIHRGRAEQMGWSAPRPAYSALGSERGMLLPSLEDALGRFIEDRKEMFGP